MTKVGMKDPWRHSLDDPACQNVTVESASATRTAAAWGALLRFAISSRAVAWRCLLSAANMSLGLRSLGSRPPPYRGGSGTSDS
jgi:hypothetical protein